MRGKQEVEQYLKQCKSDNKKYGKNMTDFINKKKLNPYLETEDYAILRTQIEILEWVLNE